METIRMSNSIFNLFSNNYGFDEFAYKNMRNELESGNVYEYEDSEWDIEDIVSEMKSKRDFWQIIASKEIEYIINSDVKEFELKHSNIEEQIACDLTLHYFSTKRNVEKYGVTITISNLDSELELDYLQSDKLEFNSFNRNESKSEWSKYRNE